MEQYRRRSSAESGISFLERALNGLSIQRSKSPAISEQSEPPEDSKGPLGLNLLHVPSEPLVDFIFVHGLGGGSRKTWSKSTNLYHYWPKEWLPRDPDFKNVRVSSFGYVADWGEKKDSVLEIGDFARSLLGEIKENPEIRKDDTRVVLVGHSMGGLVIKQAYILARQDPAFRDLVPRFHTIYFLATPHRGSDLARTLTNILKVTYGQKPYVNDLEPNSSSISSINDTFRHYAQDLQLWSFYETLPSGLVLTNSMVVDKTSATLGYPNERSALLNANHRGVCKFDRPSDPNYKTIRNAFNTTVDGIIAEVLYLRQEASRSDLNRLVSFLGTSDLPEDDLIALEHLRLPGSCQWLTSKIVFEEWRSARSNAPSLLWLSGNPTSGKSVLASHVVSHLQQQNLKCSYFFFKHSVATKSSTSDCLRSLAYQMAISSADIRRKFLLLEAHGVTLEKNDERLIWRKLFLETILDAEHAQPHYWVIDALDECNYPQSFCSLLSNIEGHSSLRVLTTSRRLQDIERAFSQADKNLTHLEIFPSDTTNDIKSFIKTRIDRLPVEDDESCLNLTDRILRKSEGSFLWVRLVMQELDHTWSEEGVEEVLNEIPIDMSLLYQRTLKNLAKSSRTMKIAKTIFTWIVCASRLLTVSEMQCALKLDIKETVPNLDRSIASICGQLAFVDQRSRVQMIHKTARDFLIHEAQDSVFAVDWKEGHARLAIKCLDFLSGNSLKAPRTQKQKPSTQNGQPKVLALADYACTFFSDHLYKTSSLHSGPWDSLYDFLGSNILSWIEHLARTGDLYHITRTATNLKAYLERRAKYFPPLGQQVQTVEAWSVDLIRVSAKFRTSLISSPSSIHWLIPPMCPQESIIAQKFTSPRRGLTLRGSIAKRWDDCLTQVNYRGSLASAVRYGDRLWAVGLSNGTIMIYHSISGQAVRTVEHLERVKNLEFGSNDELLASSGLRVIRVWNLSSGCQIWSFEPSHQVLTLAFANKSTSLCAATQGDNIACWSLTDGKENAKTSWYESFPNGITKSQRRQPPTHAVFSPDRTILAVSYRGRPILLFDVESEVYFGDCVRYSSHSSKGTDTHYPIVAMTFNPNQELNLLVASYGDGELTVYNPWTLELRHRVPQVNAQALACSPDGRTLVTGSSFGTIQIFDFDGVMGDSLLLIYRINAYDEGIKSLTFSGDSTRFIDIRGSQCRVWEPSVLIRKELDDCDQSEISDPVPVTHKSVSMVEDDGETEITAMTCHPNGDIIFCGKRDGSITTYLTQDGQEGVVLYKHATNISITFLVWGSQRHILASADESSRIIVRTIIKLQTGWSASDILVDQRFPESISGLLVSPTNNRLLISGTNLVELWETHGRKVGAEHFILEKFRKATCHPLQVDNFIIFEPLLVHIFSWEHFEKLSNSEGIHLVRSRGTVLKDTTSNSSYHGCQILAELLKPEDSRLPARLECWETSHIQSSSLSITSLPGSEMISGSVDYIIATIGTRLLFLDTDLWVCSLELKNFSVAPELKRHFFIPSEWRNKNSKDILFHYTSKDEFVFAKKDGLVVIARGLDYSEPMSLLRTQ